MNPVGLDLNLQNPVDSSNFITNVDIENISWGITLEEFEMVQPGCIKDSTKIMLYNENYKKYHYILYGEILIHGVIFNIDFRFHHQMSSNNHILSYITCSKFNNDSLSLKKEYRILKDYFVSFSNDIGNEFVGDGDYESRVGWNSYVISNGMKSAWVLSYEINNNINDLKIEMWEIFP